MASVQLYISRDILHLVCDVNVALFVASMLRLLRHAFFLGQTFYEIRCAGYFTFRESRYFGHSPDNILTKGLNLGLPRPI